MNFWIKNFLLSFLIVVISGSGLIAQEVSVKTNVNKTVTRVNEQIELQVTVMTDQLNQRFSPELPPLDGFELLQGSRGYNQNIQIINGKVSAKMSYPYYLLPKREGELKIGPVTVKYNGKEYKSQPITINVLKEDAQIPAETPDNAPAGKDYFLTANPGKQTVYQGEGLTVTYKLYYRVGVTQYSIIKKGETPGFWIEEYDLPNRPPISRETINGVQYNTATLKKVEIFPTSSGEFKLEPMIIDLDVRVRTRQTRRNIFDDFFNNPFGKTKKERVVSDTPAIKVLPLPAQNIPPGFKNAVGDFTIEGKINRTEVASNEAITYTLKISGSGNIKLINEPEISFPQDFEQYPPKIDESINKGNNGVYGVKTFEYTLVPRNPGSHTISPVSLSFFNPKTKKYQTIKTKPYTINVAKGEVSANAYSVPFRRNEVTLKGTDIRFIKSSTAEWINPENRFYKHAWFYILLVIPLLVSAGSVYYRNYTDRLQSDRGFARSKRAGKEASRRLSIAKSLISEENYEQFMSEVSHALEGFIADKLNIASAGIISDDLRKALSERSINDELISRYIACIEKCNYARFAPASSGISEMKNFYNEAASIITDFGKVLK